MSKQRVIPDRRNGCDGIPRHAGTHQKPAGTEVIILARPSKKNKAMLAPYEGRDGLTIRWGD
jgi:hypothetical protein